MAVRWYSVVIDCHDIAAQARWWRDALGWVIDPTGWTSVRTTGR